MLSLKLYIVVQSSVIYGFLFDHTTFKPGTSNQCLTLSQYYDDTQEQQHVNEELRHQTEKLRHDTDNTFALMTSQLEQKFSTISNDSIIQQHFKHNDTVLQNKFEALTAKFLAQENEVLFLKNKTVELEATIISLKIETNLYANKIKELEKLQNIQPLHDIQVLQQQVAFLTSITHSLSVKELARSQDVLSLYNKTTETEQKTNELYPKTEEMLLKLDQYQHETSEQLDTIGANINSTRKLFDEMMENATQQVALTSCVYGGWSSYAAGERIQFTDIVTEIGVEELSTFNSSGEFTCSSSGLYLVSAFILSNTNAAVYEVIKNGSLMSRVFVARHTGNDWAFSGSFIITVLLRTGDVIWVTPEVPIDIYGNKYSCLTIVKLK